MRGVMPLANVDTCFVEQKAAQFAGQTDPQKRELLSLSILDALLKANRQTLSRIAAASDAVSTEEGDRITVAYEAMQEALKDFDPQKGSFCGRYVTFYLQLYRQRTVADAPEDHFRTEIRPNGDNTVTYTAPALTAPVLRNLHKQRTYQCLGIEETAQGSWYVIRVDVDGKRHRGYVPTTENVQYYYAFSAGSQTDSGASQGTLGGEQPPEPESKEPTAEQQRILSDTLQASLFALLAAYFRQKEGEGLSRKALFCQFFTENTIRILQETGDLLREPVYHEQLIVKNMRRDWQDHLLREQGLDSFRRITNAQLKTYHEILHNNDRRTIRNSFSSGVDFSVRLPYLRARYTGTDESFQVQVSTARTLFKKLFLEETLRAQNSRLSSLAVEYEAAGDPG